MSTFHLPETDFCICKTRGHKSWYMHRTLSASHAPTPAVYCPGSSHSFRPDAKSIGFTLLRLNDKNYPISSYLDAESGVHILVDIMAPKTVCPEDLRSAPGHSGQSWFSALPMLSHPATKFSLQCPLLWLYAARELAVYTAA